MWDSQDSFIPAKVYGSNCKLTQESQIMAQYQNTSNLLNKLKLKK